LSQGMLAWKPRRARCERDDDLVDDPMGSTRC
jgi:hypothetical protein